MKTKEARAEISIQSIFGLRNSQTSVFLSFIQTCCKTNHSRRTSRHDLQKNSSSTYKHKSEQISALTTEAAFFVILPLSTSAPSQIFRKFCFTLFPHIEETSRVASLSYMHTIFFLFIRLQLLQHHLTQAKWHLLFVAALVSTYL